MVSLKTVKVITSGIRMNNEYWANETDYWKYIKKGRHMNKFEYVWLDGYRPTQSLRSKVKVDDMLIMWAFDGSSTQQATGSKSDCLLNPVAEYKTFRPY